MAIKKMRVRIGRDGRTAIQVEGGAGDDCLAFTRAVEQAVGKLEDRQLTADFHDHDPLAVPDREDVQVRQRL